MPSPLTIQWSPISKDEGMLLRAFAILAIVFHNYLHLISASPGENEFSYRPDRVHALIEGLGKNPLDAFRLLATYFGHYGVQVFFFLSGYGLMIKYRDQTPLWFPFQKARWMALYPAILMAALGYIIYESCRLNWHYILHEEGLNLIRQMIGISNFIPDNIYHPIGPWWFIGVILQFYLLFPAILNGVNRYGNKILYALIAGSLLSEFLLGPVLSNRFDFNINHSIIGNLDVCALGILFARKKEFRLPLITILIAAGLFIAGNFNASLWITTGVTSVILLLPMLRFLCNLAKKATWLTRYLMFTGQLSMYLFLCNGYLRRPLLGWAQQSPHWWTSIWTSFVFLGIATLWAILLRTLLEKLTIFSKHRL